MKANSDRGRQVSGKGNPTIIIIACGKHSCNENNGILALIDFEAGLLDKDV